MITRNVLESALAMLPVASKDPTRFHICGVRILVTLEGDKAKITLSATNGHMLLTREIAGSCPVGDYLLAHDDAAAIKLILREFKFEEIPCDIDSDGKLFLGQFTKARISKAEYYPDFEQVTPNFIQPVAITFSAEYLLAAARALSDGNKRPEGSQVRIEFDPANPDRPILVFHGSKDNGMGVIMPVRDTVSTEIGKEWSARIHTYAEVSA